MPKAVHKVKAIFLDAVDAATLGERVALLDRECAEDPALREELDALLRAHERPDPLLDHPAVEYIGARPDDVDWRAESLGCLAPPLHRVAGPVGRLRGSRGHRPGAPGWFSGHSTTSFKDLSPSSCWRRD